MKTDRVEKTINREARKGAQLLSSITPSSEDIGNLQSGMEICGLADQNLISAVESLQASPFETGHAAYNHLVSSSAETAAQKCIEFLDTLFGQQGNIELRAIGLNDGSIEVQLGKLEVKGERLWLANFIKRHYGTNNIYFGLQPRLDSQKQAANADQVKVHKIVGADFDYEVEANSDRSGWETDLVKKLKTTCPAAIVTTGGGLQAFWKVDAASEKSELEARANTLKRLLKVIGSDNVSDLPRVMRLAPTVNIPNKSKQTKGRGLSFAGAVHIDVTAMPRPFVDLVADIETAFQVRSVQSAASSISKSSPDLAPDIELLAKCIREFQPSGKLERSDWVSLAHAAHGACGGDHSVREAFIEQDQKTLETDGVEAARVWDSIQSPEVGAGALIAIIEKYDEKCAAELKQSVARDAFANPSDVDLSEFAGTSNADQVKNALTELNSKFALVNGISGVVKIGTQSEALYSVQTSTHFKEFYNGRMRVEIPDTRSPTKKVQRGLGSYWIEAVGVAPRYEEMGMWETGKEPKGALNLFRGLPKTTSRNLVPPARQINAPLTVILDFIENVICNGNAEHFEYVLNWLAYVIQNPLLKPGVNLVLIGEQGTGKSTLGNMMMDIFGPAYSAHFDRSDQLLGQFNGQLEGKLFLFMDEALFGRDRRIESVYKSVTSEDTMIIERKGQERRTVINRIALMIASNNLTAVPIDPTDRRASVFSVSNAKKSDDAYFRDLWGAWHSGGREEFIAVMQSRDLTRFSQRNPIETDAKLAIAEAVAQPATRFWLEFTEDGRAATGNDPFSPPSPLAWRKQEVTMTHNAIYNAFRMWASANKVSYPASKSELMREIETLCPDRRVCRPSGNSGTRPRAAVYPAAPTCLRLARKILGGA